MDKLNIFRTIATQASRGDLTFPTNVNAAIRIQHALNDPECHIEAASKLVLTEPLLAARTVAIANSVAYNRSGADITNVRTAVMRMGFRTLHSLVAAMVVREFGSKVTDPANRARVDQLWTHTAEVAALAHVIARKVSHFDSETAMFAGIVHEVGGFYLLSRADEFPGLLDGNAEDWVEYGEKIIGRGVLKKLGIPDLISAAVESLWISSGALPPKTLGDILLLANNLSATPSPLHPAEQARSAEQIAAIDFEVGDDTLQNILAESRQEIESLKDALLR